MPSRSSYARFDASGLGERLAVLLSPANVGATQSLVDPHLEYVRVWTGLPATLDEPDPVRRVQAIVDDLDLIDHGPLRYPGRLRRFIRVCTDARRRGDLPADVDGLLQLLVGVARSGPAHDADQ